MACARTPGKFRITTFKAVSWFTGGDKPATLVTTGVNTYFYSG